MPGDPIERVLSFYFLREHSCLRRLLDTLLNALLSLYSGKTPPNSYPLHINSRLKENYLWPRNAVDIETKSTFCSFNTIELKNGIKETFYLYS